MIIDRLRSELLERNARNVNAEVEAPIASPSPPAPEVRWSTYVDAEEDARFVALARELQAGPPGIPPTLNERLEQRRAAPYVNATVHRLESSPLGIDGVAIECTRLEGPSESAEPTR